MNKKVLITGCTGQMGSLMADYLLANTNYKIYGMVRRLSVPNHKNIDHLKNNPRFKLLMGDLTDGHSLAECIETVRPDYFINAAAQSFVKESWNSPVNTFETDAIAVIYILEAIRKNVPNCRFINFASSEMFGDVVYTPQDIKHPFRSRSPYAAAKVAAHQIVKVYRESYNLYACSAICYNYEGVRRGEEFVTRKISKGVAKIKWALDNNRLIAPISLGNVDSQRDWSDAEDIVDGIWRMLNQEIYNKEIEKIVPELKAKHVGILLPKPIEYYLSQVIREYILASGETHSIKEFIQLAFESVDLKGSWLSGQPLNRKEVPTDWSYFIKLNNEWKQVVTIDPQFFRPNEVDLLCGDSSPIRAELGWQPKITFKNLVEKMIKNDLQLEK